MKTVKEYPVPSCLMCGKDVLSLTRICDACIERMEQDALNKIEQREYEGGYGDDY